MKLKLLIVLFLLAAGSIWFISLTPAASVDGQVAYPSPTPGPDGRIIYMVKPGDTCEQLSLLYGVSVEFIRTSNLLDSACTLRAGFPILLGIAAPATPTSASGGAASTSTPTATPEPGSTGTAQICVLVYNDVNGDGLRQETEPAIPGAALSLTNLDGTFSQTKITEINPDAAAYQGMCFKDILPGKYNISAAAPEGYNPTVDLSSSFEVTPGDISYVNFGAQEKIATSNVPQPKGPSPVMGILGAALLLGGVGLGVYAYRVVRKS